jgi:hypothetical protein
MGFFDLIGNTLDFVAKPLIGFATGGPIGAIQGAAQIKGKGKILENSRGTGMFNDFTERQMGTFQSTVPSGGLGNSGGFFGNLGSTIRGFGQDVGGFLSDIRPTANLFGIDVPGGNNRPGGAQTIIRQAPDESSTSGELLGANLGMGGALVSAGRQLFRSPGGQTALGFGGGALGAALMGGGDGKVRITRRMKSDVRKIYMMAGMDPNATAQILNNLGTYPRMNFDASLVFFILTKRFRNDGPVVTKAAVRKTKTTLRRMKGVVDMYNSVCKPTTRRAPARRAAPKAVQLIKN